MAVLECTDDFEVKCTGLSLFDDDLTKRVSQNIISSGIIKFTKSSDNRVW